MHKEDARTLDPAAQEEKRKTAVRLSTRGLTHKDIAQQVGVHYLTVGRWLAKYREGGMKTLLAQVGGRRLGSGRKLGPDQEQRLQQLLNDKTLDQFKLQYALWTRQAVQHLIKQEAGLSIPIRFVCEYLKRWGFTVQKPKKKVYVQRPMEVQRWLDEEYPEIHTRAKAKNAEIHWDDETGLRNDEIEVFYLPAYSPELNPDEYLSCDLKAGVHKGTPLRHKKKLKRKAVAHLHKLPKMPAKVKSYSRQR